MRIQKAVLFTVACLLGACATTTSTDPLTPVQEFFAALAEEDKAKLDSLLTPNAELVMPFNPNGDTSTAGIRRMPATVFVSQVLAAYDNLRFLDARFHIANQGNSVFVEAMGDFRVARSGQPYRNRYILRFDLYDERIDRITEYVNVAAVPGR